MGFFSVSFLLFSSFPAWNLGWMDDRTYVLYVVRYNELCHHSRNDIFQSPSITHPPWPLDDPKPKKSNLRRDIAQIRYHSHGIILYHIQSSTIESNLVVFPVMAFPGSIIA